VGSAEKLGTDDGCDVGELEIEGNSEGCPEGILDNDGIIDSFSLG